MFLKRSHKRSRKTKRNTRPFLTHLLGGREIEARAQGSAQTWDAFSEKHTKAQKNSHAAQRRNALPPYRVHIQSPLLASTLYIGVITTAIYVAYEHRELAAPIVYSAIGCAFVVGLLIALRDSLFFHMEGHRLQADAKLVEVRSAQGGGEGTTDSHIFRSKLLRIHYQNIVRTFEQGNRRTWVDQDASTLEIHTMLSQRGLKQVWTLIEVLPQLGLLGTLIGLIHMFLAFQQSGTAPDIAVLSGFGAALGTTVLANLFVIVLRPVYMRNERAMNEILSSLQILMAMFILPTQQMVLKQGAQAQTSTWRGRLSTASNTGEEADISPNS